MPEAPQNQPTNPNPQADANAGQAPQGGQPQTANNPQEGATQQPANPAPGTGQNNNNNAEPAIRNNPDGGQQAPAQGEPSTQPGQGNEDYRTKFASSTQENQRLMEVLKQNGIDPRTGQPMQQAQPGQQQEPVQPQAQQDLYQQGNPQGFTDEQLQNAIPGYANLSADEKQVIRDAKGTAKTVAALQRQVAELYDAKQTTEQLNQLKGQNEFKPIAENEDAFKEYIYRKENLNKDIEHLAFKFMQELQNGTIQPGGQQQPANQEQPKPEQPGLEDGSAAAKLVGGKDLQGGVVEMTAQQAAQLRKQDHREYNRLSKEGKIKIV